MCERVCVCVRVSERDRVLVRGHVGGGLERDVSGTAPNVLVEDIYYIYFIYSPLFFTETQD